jgi:hypothetical protein
VVLLRRLRLLQEVFPGVLQQEELAEYVQL